MEQGSLSLDYDIVHSCQKRYFESNFFENTVEKLSVFASIGNVLENTGEVK